MKYRLVSIPVEFPAYLFNLMDAVASESNARWYNLLSGILVLYPDDLEDITIEPVLPLFDELINSNYEFVRKIVYMESHVLDKVAEFANRHRCTQSCAVTRIVASWFGLPLNTIFDAVDSTYEQDFIVESSGYLAKKAVVNQT